MKEENSLISDFKKFSKEMEVYREFIESKRLCDSLRNKIIDYDYSEVLSLEVTKGKVESELTSFDYGEFLLFNISKVLMKYRSDHYTDTRLYNMLFSSLSKKKKTTFYTVQIAKRTKKFTEMNGTYGTNPINIGSFLWKYHFYSMGVGIMNEFEELIDTLTRAIVKYAYIDLELDDYQMSDLKDYLEKWKTI